MHTLHSLLSVTAGVANSAELHANYIVLSGYSFLLFVFVVLEFSPWRSVCAAPRV